MSIYTEPPSTNGKPHVEDPESLDTLDELVVRTSPAARKEQAWREWMMIGLALTAVLSIMAIIISIVALASQSPSQGSAVQAALPAPTPAKPVTPAVKPESLTILVKADSEHGRLGPDGQWHDAFLPADFSVRAGATVKISFTNYDSGPHTFTSPAMGVNAMIPGGGSTSSPTQTTFTFKAPPKPGKYAWWCSVPCDPWAMSHDGYMRGYVTVKA